MDDEITILKFSYAFQRGYWKIKRQKVHFLCQKLQFSGGHTVSSGTFTPHCWMFIPKQYIKDPTIGRWNNCVNRAELSSIWCVTRIRYFYKKVENIKKVVILMEMVDVKRIWSLPACNIIPNCWIWTIGLWAKWWICKWGMCTWWMVACRWSSVTKFQDPSGVIEVCDFYWECTQHGRWGVSLPAGEECHFRQVENEDLVEEAMVHGTIIGGNVHSVLRECRFTHSITKWHDQGYNNLKEGCA